MTSRPPFFIRVVDICPMSYNIGNGFFAFIGAKAASCLAEWRPRQCLQSHPLKLPVNHSGPSRQSPRRYRDSLHCSCVRLPAFPNVTDDNIVTRMAREVWIRHECMRQGSPRTMLDVVASAVTVFLGQRSEYDRLVYLAMATLMWMLVVQSDA